MAEYIEREAVLNRLEAIKESADWDSQSNYVLFGIKEFINNAPAADVVLVVRCKECKEWGVRKAAQQQDKFGFCACNLMDTHEDFFCAYGERRTNDV